MGYGVHGFFGKTACLMIIFFEHGRLGNQLFQYCAIKKFQKNVPVVAVGMQELKSMFTGVDLVGSSIFGNLLEKFIKKIGQLTFIRMTRGLGLFTLVEEVQLPAYASFKVTPGLIKKLVYFDKGYYQADNIVDSEVTNRLVLKNEISSSAAKVLEKLPCRPNDRFFVHVRRGDYLYWPSADCTAVLPSSWYFSQIARIREKFSNAYFIIVSDDHPYIENLFSKEINTFVLKGDVGLDFAVMTQCYGGGIVCQLILLVGSLFFKM
jgi:hypothetical protein